MRAFALCQIFCKKWFRDSVKAVLLSHLWHKNKNMLCSTLKCILKFLGKKLYGVGAMDELLKGVHIKSQINANLSIINFGIKRLLSNFEVEKQQDFNFCLHQANNTNRKSNKFVQQKNNFNYNYYRCMTGMFECNSLMIKKCLHAK